MTWKPEGDPVETGRALAQAQLRPLLNCNQSHETRH